MSTRVFVYGTLKAGLSNHGWLRGQRFFGPAETQPRYRMFDLGGYPGMVECDDGIALEGEVWEVDAAGLQRLDVLEGVAEGEYELAPIAMAGTWQSEQVSGYLYRRPVAGLRDAGACWKE